MEVACHYMGAEARPGFTQLWWEEENSPISVLLNQSRQRMWMGSQRTDTSTQVVSEGCIYQEEPYPPAGTSLLNLKMDAKSEDGKQMY